MSKNAISVQGLGKEYIIGHKKSGDMRHAIGDKFRSIFTKNEEKESFWALKDINFEIKHGEAVGIIGRNGAGKSTLLKILSRITEPTKGRFTINGRVSSLLEVGTGFHMELTGRENIYLNGTILGMKRAEIKQKFDEIVDFSGVEKFLDTPVKHYSSGMKVRLAFSVAAHLEPEILIVDEVLAVGDAEFQKKCLGKMDQVSKNEGRTVIFVSHNMGAVETLCDKGIILDQGSLNESGSISEIVSLYFKNNNNKNISNINKEGVIIFSEGKNKKNGIQSVEVYVNGSNSFRISAGDMLELKFQYLLNWQIRKPVLGLVARNSRNQILFGINNKHTGDILNNNELEGTITIKIEHLNIYGNDEIIFDIYFGDNEDNFDTIKDAFVLELVANDVFKTGHLLNPQVNQVFQNKIKFLN